MKARETRAIPLEKLTSLTYPTESVVTLLAHVRHSIVNAMEVRCTRGIVPTLLALNVVDPLAVPRVFDVPNKVGPGPVCYPHGQLNINSSTPMAAN